MKRKRLLSFTLILAILFSAFSAVPQTVMAEETTTTLSANMLSNPGYEDGFTGWYNINNALVSDHAGFVIDTAVAHGGSQSAKTDPAEAVNVLRYRNIQIKANTDYIMSAYVKVSGENVSTFLDAHLAPETDPGTDDIRRGYIEADTTIQDEWQLVTSTFNTGDYSGKINVRIAALSCDADNTVWVDDFSLVEVITDDGGVDGFVAVTPTPDSTDYTSNLSKWTVASGSYMTTDDIHSDEEDEVAAKSTVDSHSVLRSAAVSVEPNTDYVVSTWVKIPSASSDAWIEAHHTPGVASSLGNAFADKRISGKWQQISYRFNTGASTEIDIRLNTVVSGVVFDDVTLVKADALDPQGKELLSNGGFENGVTGYSVVYGGYTLNTSDVVSGENSLSLDSGVLWYPGIRVKSNTEYAFSADVKISAAGISAWTDIQSVPGNDASTNVSMMADTRKVGEWQHLTTTFNSRSSTQIFLRLCGMGGGTISFDNVSIQAVNAADPNADVFEDYGKTFPTGVETVANVEKSYTLSTDTTTVGLAAATDGLYITSLKTDEDGTEYVSESSVVPMVETINEETVTWVYDDSKVSAVTNGSTTVGKKVTAVYKSEDGKYKTEITATAMKGVGPVEFTQELTGVNSDISVAYTDAIGSNLLIQPDAKTTLYNFGRLRMNTGADPLFSAGGYTKTTLQNGDVEIANIENSYVAASGYLPYEVLNMGDHGVYFGYYWSFGQMMVGQNNDKIGICTWLGDDTSVIEREAGGTVTIPGFFVGIYEGDIDDGSNDMKHWYWKYKITRSIYENADEPYLSTCIDYDTVDVRQLLKIFPDIANYINVLKYDYNWTIPQGQAFQGAYVNQEREWLPDSWVKAIDGGTDDNRWELYELIKKHAANDGIDADLKLSLYMPDTYQGVDLGTEEGRNAQLQALKDRFTANDTTNSVGYDYWRSDFRVEANHDYDSHEGLLYVLDGMIEYSDEFRYEHCSSGGALKDFTSLERITFMTTEDYAMPLAHRMSLYANTYMISPVQLRADINCIVDLEIDAGGRGYISVDEDSNGIPADTDPEYVDYFLRTCMLGTGLVTFDIDGFQTNMETIKKHCDLYNNVQREILRDCNVYHILDAPTGYDYDDWDGIMYYNDNINKGVVQLFKLNEEVGGKEVPDDRTIVLKGLKKNTKYSLTFIDRTEQNCVMAGAELMSSGITVTGMTEQYDSEIIYIQPYSAEEDDVLVKDIVVSGDDIMIVGEKQTLTAEVTPEDADKKDVTWTSSDDSIATVDENGVVTAVSEGIVKITATAMDGSGASGFITITVTARTEVTPDNDGSSGGTNGGDTNNGNATGDIPKTGDDFNMILWIAIAVAALLGTGVFVYFARRKRKE